MIREFQYVPLSSSAVASVALGCLATLSLVQAELGLIALPGIFLGILAVGRTRTYELAGRGLARSGIILSAITGCAGSVADYVQHVRTAIHFQEEAPEGYRRVHFGKAIAPLEKRDDDNRESLDSFVGQRICLKGYLPAAEGHKRCGQFSLTADDAYSTTMDERVLVPVDDSFCQDWSYSGNWPYDALAVSGILAIIPPNRRDSRTPKYELRQPVVRQSKSAIQLSEHKGTKC